MTIFMSRTRGRFGPGSAGSTRAASRRRKLNVSFPFLPVKFPATNSVKGNTRSVDDTNDYSFPLRK